MTIGLKLHFTLLDAVEEEVQKKGYSLYYRSQKGIQQYSIRNSMGHMISGWKDLHGTAKKIFPGSVCKYGNCLCRVHERENNHCLYYPDITRIYQDKDQIEEAVKLCAEKEDLTIRVCSEGLGQYGIRRFNVYDMDGCIVLCNVNLKDIYNFLTK